MYALREACRGGRGTSSKRGKTTNVENEFVLALAYTEYCGLYIDRKLWLQKVKKSTELLIESKKKLNQYILDRDMSKYIESQLDLFSSERKVNINWNSDKQVKPLFKELGINITVKEKGVEKESIEATVLLPQLKNFDILPLYLNYKKYEKDISTYGESFLRHINPVTGRVHTSFNQTVTATGRLSSSGPNLQNIPIRTELGREIRKAFIPKKGYSLLGADYSQIELRVIASLSDDDKMIVSFNKGEDIHARTAAEINNKKIEEVSKTERRNAKEVNFGVMYGLGARGLAQRTGLSFQEAKDFIERYFILYERVRNFLDSIKERAHQDKFVETLFGRKRYIPDIDGAADLKISATSGIIFVFKGK